MFPRLKTIRNIKRIEDDLYRLDYYADYKLDELLNQGAKDVEELTKFVSKKLFFGYPIKVEENLSACSAFGAITPEGKRIVGRNFDYPNTGAMVVYTQPKNAYRSYSMICLAHLDMTKENDTMPNKLIGRIKALSSPYACVDGLNEKGLSVSVLELYTEPTAQSTGKIPITTTVAIRMLLDKCVTTDEAIEMLNEYDMYSSAGHPYHLFVSDISGNNAVVGWPMQKLTVIKDSYVTNFQLFPGKDKGVGIGQDRYEVLENAFEESNGVMCEDKAMRVLRDAKVPWNGKWATQWSIVYNLSDFSAKICKGMKYHKVHDITS
jgi:hypothetical protein